MPGRALCLVPRRFFESELRGSPVKHDLGLSHLSSSDGLDGAVCGFDLGQA